MRIILKILLFFLVAIIHLSFIPSLPGIFSCLNIVILTLVLVLILYNFKLAAYLSLFFGFFIDTYSFGFFGVNLFSLILTIITTNFFLHRFFTNKSNYSFIFLTVIAIFSHQFFKALFLFIINFVTKNISYRLIFSGHYFLNLFYEVIINAAVMFVLFYGISYFTGKLKTMFVAK